MATQSGWQDDLYAAVNPQFFEEAAPVQLPELSWRDVEDAAHDAEIEHVAEPASEPVETPEEKAQREEVERAQRLKTAEKCFDRTRHDAKLLRWQKQQAAMDRELESGKIQYRDLHRATFAKVITLRSSYLHRSGVRVQSYSDAGGGSRKAAEPNKIDFITDSELSARQALKTEPGLLKVFMQNMESEFEQWTEVPVEIRTEIECRVGWRYLRNGLHPSMYWTFTSRNLENG